MVYENLNPEEQEALDGSPAKVRVFGGAKELEKLPGQVTTKTEQIEFARIKFQLGPVKEHGVNGTSIETILRVLIRRLEGFQNGPFKCKENELALNKLNKALIILDDRTRARKQKGVEGTNENH